MSTLLARAIILSSTLAVSCSAAAPPTSDAESVAASASEALTTAVQVTGQGGTTSASASQAETVINVSTDSSLPGGQVITVAYNDMTGARRDASDTLMTGTRLLGYATSTDGGQTWTTHAPLASPDPSGYPVMGGDPTIASAPNNPRVVYAGNLAYMSFQIDASGVVPASAVPAGYCVFKSTDGGQFFAPFTCWQGAAFHDGGSMAVADDGSVYVASEQLPDEKIDIWQIEPTYGGVSTLPRPFSDPFQATHPRLRAAPGTGRVYLTAGVHSGAWSDSFALAYWDGSSWSPEIKAGGSDYMGDSAINFSVAGAVRTGPEFSLDVTSPQATTACYTAKVCMFHGHVFYPPVMNPVCPGVWQSQFKCSTYYDHEYDVRLAYTAARNPALGIGLSVKAYACDDALTGCREVPQWEPPATAADRWEPVLRGGAISYESREYDPTGNTFALMSAEISFGRAYPPAPYAIVPVPQATGLDVCPIVFGSERYAGDYDDFERVPAVQPGVSGRWMRTFTQMPATCTSSSRLTTDQHVGAIVFF